MKGSFSVERLEVTRQARDEDCLVEAEGGRQFSGVYYRDCGLQVGVREGSVMRS